MRLYVCHIRLSLSEIAWVRNQWNGPLNSTMQSLCSLPVTSASWSELSKAAGRCEQRRVVVLVMTAGTSISKYYRFLSKTNEWCWLQTRATIVYNTTKQPQYIVCMNYIVR